MPQLPGLDFDNSYSRELKGFYADWQGDPVPDPQVLRLNTDLANELGLDADVLDPGFAAGVFSGAQSPDGAAPLAMAYAGHQFGGFSAQLGDGRAILVGDFLDPQGQRRDLHLKGSGRTPFSRGGDGKAVLGPVLREYLMGEAMHHLGIPTTRALAAVTTGEQIMRDGLEPGAVLARIASSHLRVGTFQYFAARRERDKVRQLADYAIARHYPELKDSEAPYLDFFRAVLDRQAELVAQWVLTGFVHGVMNTDNMTISGETIDYGPCAFIDAYDPVAVFSSIDRQGRYAYGNQPQMAQWNLARLAEALLELLDPKDSDKAIAIATEALSVFPERYQDAWLRGMRAKLGLGVSDDGDLDLANDLHSVMEGQEVDFTNLFRRLADVVRGETAGVRALFNDPTQGFDAWLVRYQARIAQEQAQPAAIAAQMDRVNPLYIPRNHLVEDALKAAGQGDMAPFDRLLEALSDPFTQRAGLEGYALPAPKSFGDYTTFCGT